MGKSLRCYETQERERIAQLVRSKTGKKTQDFSLYVIHSSMRNNLSLDLCAQDELGLCSGS